MVGNEPADLFQVFMRLWKIFAVRPFAFEKIWDGIASKAVNSRLQPKLYDVDHLLPDDRVVVIQIGLLRIKAVKIVFARMGIELPVGFLRIDKDDTRILESLVRRTPKIIIPLGRAPPRA